MHLPAVAELLTVCERGQGLWPVQQALLLLAVAQPTATPEALLNLPLGQRDAALLRLREQLFGPHLESVLPCPACGQALTLKLATTDLLCPPPASDLHLTLDGQRVAFRLPTSADVLAVSQANNALHNLVTRCLLAPTANALTSAQLNTIAEQMAVADPQAEILLALTCPDCGHQWRALFDIVSFLWAELNAWAQRLLREVHLLAAAYGWPEAHILALSPWRRQHYLQLVRGL